MDSLARLSFDVNALSQRQCFVAGFAVAAAVSVLLYLPDRFAQRRVIELAPSTEAAREQQTHPYPPDALPGGRTCSTPYGRIRVYEWGPEDGRKLLFIPGISTPCSAFADLAQSFVERGCRVMFFDLFGRGYSDGPLDLPYDARLYTTQVLLALASSRLSWTTAPGFDLVGYSMGGGVSMAFARHFPALVRSLTLICTGGVIRRKNISWRSVVLYSTAIFPEWFLQQQVRKRLGPAEPQPASKRPHATHHDPENAVAAEVRGEPVEPDDGPAAGMSTGPASKINVDRLVGWQLATHPGFVSAFMSSIRNAPIYEKPEDWRVVGDRLRSGEMHLDGGKVLVLLGEDDEVVVNSEIAADAKAVLGDDGVLVIDVPHAGHSLPISRPLAVVDGMFEHWGAAV